MKLALIVAACTLSCSAMAATKTWTATASGSNMNPINIGTSGTASVTLTLDTVTNIAQISGSFSGLSGTTTSASINCCTPFGSNVSPSVSILFPTGVNSGNFTYMFNAMDASSYTSGFLSANGGTAAGAFAALFNGTNTTRAYFDIYTTAGATNGEIRGFFRVQAVPEPATYGLMGLGLLGLAALKRRKTAVAA